MRKPADAAGASEVAFRPLDAAAFERDAAAFLEIAADVPGEYWTAENFLWPLPEKWSLSFAAYDGDRPVAYAILSRKTDHRVHLHHLTMAQPFRGLGLGARMVEATMARAREAGARELSLKSRRTPRLLSFYRRHGFVRIGEDNGHAVFVHRLDRPADRPVVVAIHQPNYLPWLGYFHKIAQADVFVFLETVQFSKGGYTNRAQILRDGKPVWLTQPVQQSLGQRIETVAFAETDWPRRHLDTLHGVYCGAAAFRAVLPMLESLLLGAPLDSLAAANRHVIEGLAAHLGLRPLFARDGALGVGALERDDRLVALVDAVAPGAVYLSGKGGAFYQDEAKFAAAGIALRYNAFEARPYEQVGGGGFVPGLSIVDALFSLGVEGVRALIAPGG